MSTERAVPTLFDLVDNDYTDKNTLHSYLPIYQTLFELRLGSVKRFMEIGTQSGGSIKLWSDYFKDAYVHGVDIHSKLVGDKGDEFAKILGENPRVKLHLGTNAYSDYFIRETFAKPDLKFDIIIDDGSHVLADLIFYVKNYIHFLTPETGLLIVEDIPKIEWVKTLYDSLPDKYKQYCYYCDLREKKGRFDDIMLFVDFTKSCASLNSEIKPFYMYIEPPQIEKSVEVKRHNMKLLFN